jgi:hypothetical protein
LSGVEGHTCERLPIESLDAGEAQGFLGYRRANSHEGKDGLGVG